MKYLSIICLIGLVSCAHHRAPASMQGQQIAYDSIALGNVQAHAVKRVEKEDVCFDINLKMKGVEQQNAQTSNWTLAWVDKNDQYHLLNTSQRDPASVPQGGQIVAPYGAYQEWTSNFVSCAPKARLNDVKALVLTPKELPYKESKGLTLNWQ
jgi:hypothetical protein